MLHYLFTPLPPTHQTLEHILRTRQTCKDSMTTAWTKGQRVEIHSLVGRPELNGRSGTVSGLKPDGSGRVGVKVDGEESLLALKPAALTLLGGTWRASAAENAAAATKAAEARSAAVRLAGSVAKAHKPPTVLWTCRFCRNALAPTSFSPRERPKARRCCTGCNFRVHEEGGVRYAKAVAACIVLQARARGSMVRCGKAPGSPPSGAERVAPKPAPTPATEGAASEAQAAEAEAEAGAAEPTPKELALSCAVALYDQMASAGIAPPALVPLRPRLPALAELAYERNTGGLVDALNAAGLTDLKLLQRRGTVKVLTLAAAHAATHCSRDPPTRTLRPSEL